MNTLDLPPRRTLPGETRDRIRRSIDTGIAAPRRRFRTPLAAAAAVAVLALGAVAVASWAPGAHDDRPPAATRTTSADSAAATAVTTTLPDGRTEDDLDRCADVIAASPRADRFPPRSEWRAAFTAHAPDGTRVTAFRTKRLTPMFCEVTATTATVSTPLGERKRLAASPSGTKPAAVYAVYLSPTTGLLAGIGPGVDALEFSIVRGMGIHPVGVPAYRDEMFVVNLGVVHSGDSVRVVGRDDEGLAVADGMVAYSPQAFPPIGATGPVG